MKTNNKITIVISSLSSLVFCFLTYVFLQNSLFKKIQSNNNIIFEKLQSLEKKMEVSLKKSDLNSSSNLTDVVVEQTDVVEQTTKNPFLVLDSLDPLFVISGLLITGFVGLLFINYFGKNTHKNTVDQSSMTDLIDDTGNSNILTQQVSNISNIPTNVNIVPTNNNVDVVHLPLEKSNIQYLHEVAMSGYKYLLSFIELT